MEITSSNPAHVRKWLSHNHPKQFTLLSQFEMELRLGRLSTSSTFSARNFTSAQSTDPNSTLSAKTPKKHFQDGCSSNIGGQDRRLVTKRTMELLRTLIGATRWKTAAQLLFLLRGLGRELYSAGGFREPAIGNVVRRIMCAVRDEALALSNLLNHGNSTQAGHGGGSGGSGGLEQMMESKLSLSDTTKQRSSLSLSTMLWTHTQHAKSTSKAVERELLRERFGRNRRSDSVTSVNSRSSHNPPQPHLEAQDSDDEEYYHDEEEEEYGFDFPPSFFVMKPELKERIMEAVQETLSELDDLHKNINEQALNHIHAGEIILCYGRSKTIEYFLKAAASKSRSFHVIIAEGAPHFSGHAMAKSLATYSHSIPTTIIHDAATFAIMARVNKVLLPAHAVLANGGLVAPSGSHMVALAARQNSVPVVCVTGMYKLCPQFPHEGQETLNDLVSPSSVMEYGEVPSMLMMSQSSRYSSEEGDVVGDGGASVGASTGALSGTFLQDVGDMEEEKKFDHPCQIMPDMQEVELINPVHDYIPPDLIKLYVTNIGGFQPSYIYKLLAEYYHPDDWESFE